MLLISAILIYCGVLWIVYFEGDEFFTFMGWGYVFTGCLGISTSAFIGVL